MASKKWEIVTTVLFIAILLSSSLLFYQVYLHIPYEPEMTIQSLCRRPLKALTIASGLARERIYVSYSSADFWPLTPFIGHYYPLGGWMTWVSTDSKVLLNKYYAITPDEKTILCFTWIKSPFQTSNVNYEDYGDEVIRSWDDDGVFVTIWGKKTAEVLDFINLTLNHLDSYLSEKWNSSYIYTDTIENVKSRMLTHNGYIEVYPNLPNFWSDDTGKLVTALIDYYDKIADPNALDVAWRCNQLLFAAQNELGHFWTRKYVGPVYISTEHEYEKITSVRNWLIEFNYVDETAWFRRDGCDTEFRWEPKIWLSPRVEIKPKDATAYQTKFLRDYDQRSVTIVTQTEENVTVCLQYDDPVFPTLSVYVSVLKAEPSVKIWFTYVSKTDLEDLVLWYGFESLEDFWLKNGASGVGPRYCYTQGKVLGRNDQNPMLITNESVNSLVLFDNATSLRGRMILLVFKDAPNAIYDCFSNGDADGDGLREFDHLSLKYELGSAEAGLSRTTGSIFLVPFYDADVWQWREMIEKVCSRITKNLLESGRVGFMGFELSDIRNQAPIIESLLNSALFWTKTPHSLRNNACFEIGKFGLDSYLKSIVLGRALSGYEIGYLLMACSHAYHLTYNENYRIWEKQLADQIIAQQISNPSDLRYGGYIDSQAIQACHLDVVAIFLIALRYAYDDFADQAYFESSRMCVENWIHLDSEQGAWGYREGVFTTDGGGQTNKQGIIIKALVLWGYVDIAKTVAEFFFKHPVPPYGLAPVAPTFNDPWGASWDINSETLAWSLSGLISLMRQ